MKEVLQNKNEVLRYLGYKGQKLDKITSILVEESMKEIKKLMQEKYIYKVFDISRGKDKLWLEGSDFKLVGNDIKKHLLKSDQCILLAVTLGHNVDTKIRYYEKVSMTKALLLDACATVAIEDICDRICEDIEEKVIKDNKALTSRYSPGYGDLPIELQNEFLSVIEGQKLAGITATYSGILIPRKSITAIMGFIDIKDKEEISCLDCTNYSTCVFRKGGRKCGA